ncbi:MAG: glutathione S-transferase N-terminal domain-containing protein [Rhodobacteraceae bacterium]|nr:glutathione S-transferase N-terminal domain-containing protein [Paracoccaceae bacterium]
MILIGQYDSSFVRRVAVALTLYGFAFEHRPWSVFGDMDLIRPFNPLVRVPTLVLANGESIIDSHLIIDHIDGLVDDDAVMLPRAGEARRRALGTVALATGMADRMVSLFYERALHDQTSELLVARRTAEIAGALHALEAQRLRAAGPWWRGERIGHDDIAVACALRHLAESLPDLWDPARHPALAAHAARAEALPVFAAVSQPFVAPA